MRAILSAVAILGLVSQSVRAQNSSDFSLEYRYQPFAREPGVANSEHPNGIDINKHIATVSYVNVGKYLAQFINIDVLKSDSRDRANNSKQGAVEVYALYRGNASLNAIFDTNNFTFGPIRDVTFEFGGDINTKNTAFAPQKNLLILGPNIHLNVPGFLNIGLHFSKEWNNNGIVGRSVSFDPAFELEIVGATPLTFTGLPLRVEGFFNLVTPKGRDGFGNRTATEILAEPRLTLDLGALALDRPKFLDVSVGYQFWYNKFGNQHPRVPGSLVNTPFLATRVHF